ncbi:MAG: insulinase family protein, partial [Bacteroidetes bacterium]
MCWLSLCAGLRLHAQQLATAFSLSDTLPLRPDLRMATLPNGLRYYLLPNKTPENRAELRLVVHAGSLQEEDDQLGVAHFVEHMAFNGSRHFKKNELIDYLEHTGVRFGADLNAYTSFEETVYMLQARSDSLELLEKGLLILQDWAGGVSFEREEVDKERGVVIEEWRTRLSADQRLQQKTFPVLYEGSRYARRLPIGKPEIIEQIGLKRVKQFYKDWYRPDLMAVVATGDFDPAWMEAQIRARFGKLRMPTRPRPREDYPIPPQPGTRYAMFTDPETPFTRATIRYKHKAQKVKTVGDFRQNIIRNLYNRMLNARMQDIGRQAHPPFTFAYAGYGNNISDLATYTVYAFTAEGEAIRGLEAVFGEVKRAQLHGFTSTELERHKAEIMANVERAYLERDKSASDNLAMGCVYHYLQGHSLLSPAQTLALYRQLLPGIGLQEVNEAGRNWITDENRVVTITGPEKEGVPLPTVAELEAMFERFERMQPPPYEDGVKAGPLLEQPLPPGQVVDTRYHDSVQVQEWKLANGVRVVLKPTDFKNDEILMSSFSPGGHSLYSDADFHTASRAALLVSEGGVGNFDFLQLQKKLAGKRVNVGPYIDELYEGLSGSCSPAELETLLQLVYLYFTAPRKDPQALAAFVSQQKSFLQNMRASPGYHVAIESAKIRYGNHFRRQALPTLADIEAIDLDRALAIYRDRFADASDFTFVFVGNLEPDSVRDLIATYLGNLPATWRKEQGRDVGARLV